MYDLGKKPVRSGPAPFRYWLSVVLVSAVIASLSMTARFGDSQAVAEASSADTSAAVEPAAEWQSDNGLGSNLSATGQVYGGGHGTAGAGTQPPSATTSPMGTTSPGRKVAKTLTLVVENHSTSQMQRAMPYVFGLAKRFGYASNWSAIRHPSLPNYLALTGGSTAGATDASPPSHPVAGRSVFGVALAARKTAKVYQEGMKVNCQSTPAGRYAPKHNPWAYYVNERSACRSLDVPVGTLTRGPLHSDIVAGTLPAVGEVTPDLCNDAHDCSLAAADSWLRAWLTRVFAGPDWRSGKLAVVITADEDDGRHGNVVLTLVIHPSQNHRVVNSRLNHYSWTRLVTDLMRGPCLNRGCSAASMSAAFGLPL